MLDDICGVCVDVNSLIDDSTLVSSSGTLEPVSGLEPVIYVKENYATNEPTNWDWISDDVALFRNDQQGLFNAVQQGGWQEVITGTLWGPPGSSDLSEFTPNWRTLMCNLYNDCSYAQYLPGEHQTLFVISTETFYDIEYVSWTQGNSGGGFSYIRTELNSPFQNPLESAVTLTADTVRFEYTDQIETWNVPNNVVLLQIEAIGAKGGNGRDNNQGGYGAKMQGWFDATSFEELQVLVGEAGFDFGNGSGGGGSFCRGK